MVRKQLYIEEAQDAALKRRARELGVSEAELVRRALDSALAPAAPAPGRRNSSAIAVFLENAERISREHQLPAGYRFDRQELYDEREDRLVRRP